MKKKNKQSLFGHYEDYLTDSQYQSLKFGTNSGTNNGQPFKRMKDFTDPKISKGKEWLVHFRVLVNQDGVTKWKQYKYRADLNKLKGKERLASAEELRQVLHDRLVSQWRPEADVAYQKPKTLIEVFNELLKIKEPTIRRRTWQSYKYAIDLIFTWIKNSKLSEIIPEQFNNQHALQYLDWVGTQRKLSGRAYNFQRNTMFTFFEMMLDREMIGKNPFRSIKEQPVSAGRHLAYSEEEWTKLLDHLKETDPRFYLFCQFIYFTYLRPIELLRLKVSNVNIKEGLIIIHGDQSKNRKQESVVIPDSFRQIFDSMELEKFPGDYYIFGMRLETSASGYNRNSVSAKFKKVREELGFSKDHTLYSCKHTGVSRAVSLGVSIYDISRQCRHKSISETQTYYRSLGLVPNTGFRTGMK